MSTDDSSPSLLGKIFGRTADPVEDEDPQAVLDKAHELSKEEMVDAAERFHLLSVEDVMVPRADIVAIDSSATLTELSESFKEAGHSRLPVYKDTLDEPTGMVHIKDVMPYLMFDAKGRNGKTYPSKKVIQYIRRPVMFVPPSMLARDLLKRMQARRSHMAIVVDEYGDTLGGLVFTLAGRVPERGEIIRHPDGIEFEVIDADQRRVKRLRINDTHKRATPAAK